MSNSNLFLLAPQSQRAGRRHPSHADRAGATSHGAGRLGRGDGHPIGGSHRVTLTEGHSYRGSQLLGSHLPRVTLTEGHSYRGSQLLGSLLLETDSRNRSQTGRRKVKSRRLAAPSLRWSRHFAECYSLPRRASCAHSSCTRRREQREQRPVGQHGTVRPCAKAQIHGQRSMLHRAQQPRALESPSRWQRQPKRCIWDRPTGVAPRYGSLGRTCAVEPNTAVLLRPLLRPQRRTVESRSSCRRPTRVGRLAPPWHPSRAL